MDKLGPKLNAVATVTRELGLKEARTAEEEIKAGKYRGPLHGIPYGVKDLLATNGIPTTWGAKPFKDQVFDFDATAVRKLRAAGAVLVAKLAMVELAGGFGYNTADASFTGPWCRLPSARKRLARSSPRLLSPGSAGCVPLTGGSAVTVP
jgi:aspartyl-tRNA(Asn)/glutamyl-tRNA(Gln) amidotransferase subunit A